MREDCWTLDQFEKVVLGASVKSKCVTAKNVFDYKPALTELYKNVLGVTKYQFFRMEHARPGVVECMVSSTSTPYVLDLRRSLDRALTLIVFHSLAISAENATRVHSLIGRIKV
ncbi:TPA: hypothetical protein N0F65_005354 [Lagenidium giganteum]|uniref:Uncharacterized protein n=1 Tax=Lagenidium giganteum TaxID=4803 RepID=A0AAV2YKD5_9STRA|nr:TPA: hypothetical protein N0F65_005354 [Lagenidium giganteum]